MSAVKNAAHTPVLAPAFVSVSFPIILYGKHQWVLLIGKLSARTPPVRFHVSGWEGIHVENRPFVCTLADRNPVSLRQLHLFAEAYVMFFQDVQEPTRRTKTPPKPSGEQEHENMQTPKVKDKEA